MTKPKITYAILAFAFLMPVTSFAQAQKILTGSLAVAAHSAVNSAAQTEKVEVELNLIDLELIASINIGEMHFSTAMVKDASSDDTRAVYNVNREHDSYGNYLAPDAGKTFDYQLVAAKDADGAATYALICKNTEADKMSDCPSGTVIPLHEFVSQTSDSMPYFKNYPFRIGI